MKKAIQYIGVNKMRYSNNDEVFGAVRNGFDYDLQVWVKDYIIQDMRTARESGVVGKDIREVKNRG